MVQRFCNEKFWNRLTNIVKAQTNAEIMSSMPKTQGIADDVGSGLVNDIERRTKLPISTDDIS